jgi:hypothetical protein
MRKILFFLIILNLVLAFSSCKRSEVVDPSWDDPAGFYIQVKGHADPAVFFIDGAIHRSTIYVRATDNKGRPIAGRTVFLEQLPESTTHQQIEWGYFENNTGTIRRTTNANGEVSVSFYSPTQYHSGIMFIHAVIEVDDRAYPGSLSHVGTVPQDYIAISMYNSGAAGTGATK